MFTFMSFVILPSQYATLLVWHLEAGHFKQHEKTIQQKYEQVIRPVEDSFLDYE